MHVAILIGRFPPGVVGGAEIQAQSWAARLAVRHRITVITRRETPGPVAREARDGFEVVVQSVVVVRHGVSWVRSVRP